MQTLNRATLADLFFLGSQDAGCYMDVINSLTKGDSILGIFEGTKKVRVLSLSSDDTVLPTLADTLVERDL